MTGNVLLERDELETLETVETTNEVTEETAPVETAPVATPAAPATPAPTDEELDRQAYERLAARHPNVIRREEEEAKPDGFDWQNPDESLARFQQQTTSTTVQLAMKAIEARDRLGQLLMNEGPEVRAAASTMLTKLTPQQLADPTAVEGIAAYVVGQAVLSGKRTTTKAPASSTPAASQPTNMSADMQKQVAIANKIFGELTKEELREVMAG